MLASARMPTLAGAWFGDGRPDVHLAWAVATLFGLSALALPWLFGQRAADDPGKSVAAG